MTRSRRSDVRCGTSLDQASVKHSPSFATFVFPFSLSMNRSEEHTSELQSPCNLVCRLLLEKKKTQVNFNIGRLGLSLRPLPCSSSTFSHHSLWTARYPPAAPRGGCSCTDMVTSGSHARPTV